MELQQTFVEVFAGDLVDLVLVALFGEEALSFHGEFLFAGIAADERIKVSDAIFGSQDASEALCFFLS